jgi:hypothetical protein
MHSKLENPFQGLEDWQHNACISNFSQFGELGGYYVRAADGLVKKTIEDSSLLDVYILPLCFLYRHGIELLLKDSLWMSQYLARGTKAFPQTHNLGHLWRELDVNCRAIFGADFPLTSDETERLEHTLAQIENHDPASYAFRYPYDTKGNRTHPFLAHVNVRSMYETVHQVADLLYRLGERVEFLCLQKNE